MGITHVVRGEEWISSHPQARPALPVARPGAAEVRAHAAAAQHRQVQDLQAQEPGRPADLVPGAGLPARGAGELPCAAGLSAEARAPRARTWRSSPSRSSARTSTGRKVNPVGPIFDLKKLDWLNGVYIRSLEVGELASRLLPFLEADGVLADNPSLGELARLQEGHRADPDPDGAAHRGQRPGRPFYVADDELEIADDARAQLKDDAGAVLGAAIKALEDVDDSRSGVLGSEQRLDRRRRSRRPCARRSSRGWASSRSSRSVRCAPPSPGSGSARRCSSRWRSSARPRPWPGCTGCTTTSPMSSGASRRPIDIAAPGGHGLRDPRRPAVSARRHRRIRRGQHRVRGPGAPSHGDRRGDGRSTVSGVTRDASRLRGRRLATRLRTSRPDESSSRSDGSTRLLKSATRSASLIGVALRAGRPPRTTRPGSPSPVDYSMYAAPQRLLIEGLGFPARNPGASRPTLQTLKDAAEADHGADRFGKRDRRAGSIASRFTPMKAFGRAGSDTPLGYGVIGNTTVSGTVILGSSPGTPAQAQALVAHADSEKSTACRYGSLRCPSTAECTRQPARAPLCSGLARRPLKAVARVRIPSGLPAEASVHGRGLLSSCPAGSRSTAASGRLLTCSWASRRRAASTGSTRTVPATTRCSAAARSSRGTAATSTAAMPSVARA